MLARNEKISAAQNAGDIRQKGMPLVPDTAWWKQHLCSCHSRHSVPPSSKKPVRGIQWETLSQTSFSIPVFYQQQPAKRHGQSPNGRQRMDPMPAIHDLPSAVAHRAVVPSSVQASSGMVCCPSSPLNVILYIVSSVSAPKTPPVKGMRTHGLDSSKSLHTHSVLSAISLLSGLNWNSHFDGVLDCVTFGRNPQGYHAGSASSGTGPSSTPVWVMVVGLGMASGFESPSCSSRLKRRDPVLPPSELTVSKSLSLQEGYMKELMVQLSVGGPLRLGVSWTGRRMEPLMGRGLVDVDLQALSAAQAMGKVIFPTVAKSTLCSLSAVVQYAWKRGHERWVRVHVAAWPCLLDGQYHGGPVYDLEDGIEGLALL